MDADKLADLAISGEESSVIPFSFGRIHRQYSDKYRSIPRADFMGENEYMVDRAGYIPKEQQIQQLMNAGERLEEYRRKIYSNGAPVGEDGDYEDDVPLSPTNSNTYDGFDAMDDAKALKRKYEETVKAQQKAVKAEEKALRDAAREAAKNLPRVDIGTEPKPDPKPEPKGEGGQ